MASVTIHDNTFLQICIGDVVTNHETIVEGRATRSFFLGFGGERQTRTISLLIPSAASLRRAGVEQLYQVERIIGGIGNMCVSMHCSECQSGEKFKQT